MRWRSFVMAFAFLAMMTGAAWLSGCDDLSSDCELNLNCTPTAPAVVCNSAPYPGTCGTCVQEKCCKEYSACEDDGNGGFCAGACAFGALPLNAGCMSGPSSGPFLALDQCIKTNCATDCPPPDQCNPVTHNGCPKDGTACELVYPGIFVCYPPYLTPAQLCEQCDVFNGAYCGSELRCHPATSKCGRYCCNDADCGVAGERCELNPLLAFGAALARPEDQVGLCMAVDPAAGPACAVPAAPPSGGACFGGFAP